MNSNPSNISRQDWARKSRESVLWMFSSTLVWQLISWLFTLVTARLLLPEDYGIVAMNEIVYPYLIIVCGLGLSSWIVQLDKLDENVERTALSLLVLSGVITSVIGFLGASFIAYYFREPRAESLFQVCTVIYLLRSLQIIPECRIKRELNFKPIAILNVVLGIVRGFLQVFLAYFGFGFWSLVIGTIAREILYTICLLIIAGSPRQFAWDKDIVRNSLAFGLSSTSATIFWIIYSSADNIVVGRLFGSEMLGFYAMAFYLCDMPLSKLSGVLNPVLHPYFCRIKNDGQLLKETFLKVNGAVVAVISPVLIGMAVVAPTMIPIVLGEKWQGAIIPLRVLATVGLLRAITNCGSAVLYALNQPRAVLRWTAGNALTLPIGFYLLGKYIGIEGIYLAWLCLYPITGILTMMQLLRKYLGISFVEFLKNIGSTLVATLVMVASCLSIGGYFSNALIGLVAQCLIGAISYTLVFMFLFKEQASSYLRMLNSFRGVKE